MEQAWWTVSGGSMIAVFNGKPLNNLDVNICTIEIVCFS